MRIVPLTVVRDPFTVAPEPTEMLPLTVDSLPVSVLSPIVMLLLTFAQAGAASKMEKTPMATVGVRQIFSIVASS
jgi:hypothetical protein